MTIAQRLGLALVGLGLVGAIAGCTAEGRAFGRGLAIDYTREYVGESARINRRNNEGDQRGQLSQSEKERIHRDVTLYSLHSEDLEDIDGKRGYRNRQGYGLVPIDGLFDGTKFLVYKRVGDEWVNITDSVKEIRPFHPVYFGAVSSLSYQKAAEVILKDENK